MLSRRGESRPEVNRICNLVPSRNTETDWGFRHAIEARAIEAPTTPLPPSMDLREDWWNVGNQESTGSCVGWASTDGVMRYHMVNVGKISRPGFLSPRCTWMASKEIDEFLNRPTSFIEEAGTSLKSAMDILQKYGTVPEEMLPFHISTNLYSGDENVFYAIAATRRIAAYYNLKRDLDNWRTWLAMHGPIMAGLKVDETWDDATVTNGNLDMFHPGTVRGGHAICVVGYTEDKRFIIRNSWGTSWGDKGFAYASEQYIKDAFFEESYGVAI